jgi:carbamoyl-phosphate synthase large subunit
MAAAKATAEGIRHIKEHGNSEVKSLQELHNEIHDK